MTPCGQLTEWLRLSDIESAVCDTFRLNPRTLRQPSKSKSISQPRMLAIVAGTEIHTGRNHRDQ